MTSFGTSAGPVGRVLPGYTGPRAMGIDSGGARPDRWASSGKKTALAIQRQHESLCAELGARIILTRVHALHGVLHGESAVVPACLYRGQPLVFDVWVPHAGVAIDFEAREAAEYSAKWAHCERHGVLYAHATMTRDECERPVRAYAVRLVDGEEDVRTADVLRETISRRSGRSTDREAKDAQELG